MVVVSLNKVLKKQSSCDAITLTWRHRNRNELFQVCGWIFIMPMWHYIIYCVCVCVWSEFLTHYIHVILEDCTPVLFSYFDENQYIIYAHNAWSAQTHEHSISCVKTLTLARVLTLLINKFSWWPIVMGPCSNAGWNRHCKHILIYCWRLLLPLSYVVSSVWSRDYPNSKVHGAHLGTAGPMLAPWTLLSGYFCVFTRINYGPNLPLPSANEHSIMT